MTAAEIKVYANPGSLSESAAEMLLEAAESSIARQGYFTLAISGGHTPEALFRLLADGEFQRQIDWSKTHLFWVDERPVPVTSKDSNFKLANDNLISELGTKPFVHRVPTEVEKPKAVAAAYEKDLRETFAKLGQKEKWPHFDFIVLGIGDNGHTASLMPDGETHAEPGAWVDSPWVPQLKTFRFTLTEGVLNHSRQAIFLVEGKGKAKVLKEILEGPQKPKELPAQRIHLKEGRLTWLLDQDAASQLAQFRASV